MGCLTRCDLVHVHDLDWVESRNVGCGIHKDVLDLSFMEADCRISLYFVAFLSFVDETTDEFSAWAIPCVVKTRKGKVASESFSSDGSTR